MNRPTVCQVFIATATRSWFGGVALGALAMATGCTQPAESFECPIAAPGDLVITELRGAQEVTEEDGTTSPYAAFVEVYNAGNQAVDLKGAVFEFRSIDGGDIKRAIVRDEITIAPSDYLALSPSDGAGADAVPLQPTFGYDLKKNLPTNAQLTLSACDVVIDTIVYRALPTAGVWSFGAGGGATPSATANDDEDAWCTQTTTEFHVLGSPGAVNPSCEAPK